MLNQWGARFWVSLPARMGGPGWALNPVLILAPLVSLMVGGCVCAVGQVGIGHLDYLQNQERTANAIHIKSWGFLVVTNSADAGFTLGAADKLYIFRGPQSGGNPPAAVILDAVAPSPQTQLRAVKPIDFDWRNPIAFISNTAGVVVAANRNQVGMRIGAQVRNAIDLPSDSQTVLVLRYSSTQPAQASVRVKEYSP
ncbi:MAG: hypothetical protein JWL69_3985 [Phycisphaerales bacterium]|nr:hypothetical protein [Phycisphaerales bacterium]